MRCGRKTSRYSSRVALCTPSAATTRSWVREPVRGRCLGAQAQVHAEVAAAVVQDAEEAAAAEGGEAVSSGGVAGASVIVDVVPADEVRLQGLVDDRVGVFDAAEGLVGEDDAEAEGVVGGVALVDGDLTDGVEALEEGGGVEAAGASADDRGA
ncbi:hypothetical protein SVIOM342S_06110 [Streptomyces violaceorubidus]